MDLEDRRWIQARWTLGLVPSERAPAIALQALEGGLDTPTLRVLAGESNPRLSEVGPLFDRALGELGCTPLTREAAGEIITMRWARSIVRGEVSAYEGARAIWSEVCDPLDGGGRLFAFKRLASEHEDYRFARESAPPGTYDERVRECEEEIIEKARALLARGEG